MIYWGSKTPSPGEWEQHNAYAKSIVNLNVKNLVGNGIQSNNTAAEAWLALKEVHDKPSDMGLLNAENTLHAMKHTERTDIITHFA